VEKKEIDEDRQEGTERIRAPGLLCIEDFKEMRRTKEKQNKTKIEDLCVYVAIASYCEKRHAYRDRCEIRHGREEKRREENKRKIVRVIIKKYQ